MWDDQFGRLLIFDNNNKLVGSIYYFLTLPYSDALEIGFIIFDPEVRGKGIMSQALNTFTDYLFTLKKINRIDLKIDPANTPSIRVAKKAGYVLEEEAS